MGPDDQWLQGAGFDIVSVIGYRHFPHRVEARPVTCKPALGGGRVVLFVHQVRREEISVLHYLDDGWIWRLRQPRVARPLGVEG